MNILNETKKYFQHQKELYGDVVYLDKELIQKAFQPESGALTTLSKSVENCQKCHLSGNRKNVVFGRGNPQSHIFLVGDNPGEDDDREGIPFSGEAGQLLEKILHAIDFTFDEIYISHLVKCRPSLSRNPKELEIKTCFDYLKQQIDLVQPRLILALGRMAAQTLLKQNKPLNELRGEFHKYGDIDLLVTYHPAALLKNPAWKRPTWEDLQKFRFHYDEIIGDKPRWIPGKNR